MLGVCMYCERYHANTGEWVAAPPALAEMLPAADRNLAGDD
jgi:hypothetical protein